MDPVSFPALAGTALTEAIKFLFGRANAVLDRRAGRVSAEETEQSPRSEDGLRLEELSDARVERITQAKGMLSVYVSHPELLGSDNDELREVLSQLRNDLEVVYGCGFPFGDEDRPGPGVEISQHAGSVRNSQVGIRAKELSDTARVSVDQEAETIEETGEQVGIDIDGKIG